MLAPYGGTSEAMTTLASECRKRGLLPFTNYNRMHVVPPCTVSDTEVKDGLAILDAQHRVQQQHALFRPRHEATVVRDAAAKVAI